MSNHFDPTEFFDQIVNSSQEGRAHIVGDGVEWRLDIVDGRLLFAAHSLQYLTNLETVLVDLDCKAALPAYWRLTQLGSYKCPIDEPGSEVLSWTSKVVVALVKHKALTLEQAEKTLARLSEDAIASLVGLKAATVVWSPLPVGAWRPTSHGVEMYSLLHRLSGRLQGWRTVSDRIASPHQRPYCETPDHIHQSVPLGMLPRPMLEALVRLMQGASIRQLARMVNQDEIKLAQLLYPYIEHRVIKLWSPVTPLDRLPCLPTKPFLPIVPTAIAEPLATSASVTSDGDRDDIRPPLLQTASAAAPVLTTQALLTSTSNEAAARESLVQAAQPAPAALLTRLAPVTGNSNGTAVRNSLLQTAPAEPTALLNPLASLTSSNGVAFRGSFLQTAAPTPTSSLTSLAPLIRNNNAVAARSSLINQPIASEKERHLIVCIDDNQVVLETIQSYLSSERFELKAIVDPMASISKICTMKPDLVLMDISMPRIDGHSLCRILRRSFIFKDIPIIMVSSHVSALNKAKARSAGATDYLEKPFSQTTLIAKLETYLGKPSVTPTVQ
ncbi:MAG: response regulator [Leptolyngbyaceae cyanobacterium MO_188.B28]|nr:response regulator [Leptolyngbyaceae cyanobacterium MO_188.B28]